MQCLGDTLPASLALGGFIISRPTLGLWGFCSWGSPVERYLAEGCPTRLKWNSTPPSNAATQSSSVSPIHRMQGLQPSHELCIANFSYDHRKITEVRLILGWHELLAHAPEAEPAGKRDIYPACVLSCSTMAFCGLLSPPSFFWWVGKITLWLPLLIWNNGLDVQHKNQGVLVAPLLFYLAVLGQPED